MGFEKKRPRLRWGSREITNERREKVTLKKMKCGV